MDTITLQEALAGFTANESAALGSYIGLSSGGAGQKQSIAALAKVAGELDSAETYYLQSGSGAQHIEVNMQSVITGEAYACSFLVSFIRYNTSGAGELYFVIATPSRTFAYQLCGTTHNLVVRRKDNTIRLSGSAAGSAAVWPFVASGGQHVYPTYNKVVTTDMTGFDEITIN